MSNRIMPSTMWQRGRALVAEDKVQIIAIDPDMGMVEATVYGTYAYDVVLGIDQAEDDCSCPYFAEHGYCKHVAAVEVYFTAHGESIDEVLGVDSPASAHPSDAKRFIEDLELGDIQYFKGLDDSAQERLRLEVTLVCHPYMDAHYHRTMRFMIKLRIGGPDNNRFLVVRNIQDFFGDYINRDRYATGGKSSFDLAPAAFAPAERELLQTIIDAPTPDQYAMGYDSTYRQYVVLAAGDFARLKDVWGRLEFLQFQPVASGETYDTLTILPFAPDLGLWEAAVTPDETGYTLKVDWHFETAVETEHFLISGNRCIQCESPVLGIMSQIQRALPDAKQLHFAQDEVEALQTFLVQFKLIGTVDAPKTLAPASMTAHFDLDRDADAITLALGFEYDGQVYPASTIATHADMARNHAKEQQARDYLKALGFVHERSGWRKAFGDSAALYRFYVAELPNLKHNGVVTTTPALDAMVVDAADQQPQIKVSQAAGLLSIAFSMAGIKPDEVASVLTQLDQSRPYLTRPDGSLVIVDDQLKATAKALSRVRQAAKIDAQGVVQVPASQSLAVQAAFGETAEFDQHFKQLVTDLTHPETYPLGDALTGIHATLRPYQQVGVRWLEMLDAHGFGGILADEMGLGKTLQMITFLHHHRGGHTLVVAPASLLYNWQAEFTKFAPNMHVAVVAGTKAERSQQIKAADADVLITSYNQARLDVSDYAQQALTYLVLDEAQYVKNAGSKTNQALRKLQPKATFALSGTPIENRKEELWAIFALVLPGLLPSKNAFNQLTPEEIAVRVRPFILRREKAAVLKDLPPKVETNLTNDMTKAQKTVYLAQLQQMQVKVRGLSNDALVKNKLEILAGLTRLRQICDTPSLYLPDYKGGSGKLELLADLLQEAADNHRHVLIFSQFTTMLSQIQALLDDAHLPSFVLKGDTKAKDRLTMVERFNAGEKAFFLISLKAGGTGLNLTGADMVLLVDLWWNPAVEDQAIARAHRIGQKHAVDVYRLITKGTIEEQIVNLQAKKRDLVDTIMAGTANKAGLTTEDIKLILGID